MAKNGRLIPRLARRVWPKHEPEFLIIGAQKSGTTSLHHYLDQHPKLVGSKPKEVHFFERDEHYKLGIDWYRQSFFDFKHIWGKRIYFEATPDYLYRNGVAERIFKHYPDIKLIILLREPVARAFSSWNMYRDFQAQDKIPAIVKRGYLEGKENNIFQELYASGPYPSFKECMEMELKKVADKSELQEPSFIRRGIYVDQIRKYRDLFGANKVAVWGFKDLLEAKSDTLNQMLRFLDLPMHDWSGLKDEPKNKREYTSALDASIKEQLTEFYQPYNEQLFQLLNVTKINW